MKNLQNLYTPKKHKTSIDSQKLRLSESIKKTNKYEILLKNKIEKLSYKNLRDCIFEISTNLPASQNYIENYLKSSSVFDNNYKVVPLKNLTENFLNMKNDFEVIEEKKIILDFYEIKNYLNLREKNDIREIFENLKSFEFREILKKILEGNFFEIEKKKKNRGVKKKKKIFY